MKNMKFAILLLTLCFGSSTYATESGDTERVTFAVGCYDVGASALEGRPGIISVQKGWHGGREVNRVVFDPQKTSVISMESWLKSANTYIGTEPASKLSPVKEKKP